MLRLNLSQGPEWLDLGHGVRIEVLPLRTSIMTKIKGSVGAEVTEEAIADGTIDRTALGNDMSLAIACAVIVGWEGVGDDRGKPAPVTPDNIAALMDLFPIFTAFQTQYLAPAFEALSEKNASSPSRTGTTAAAIPTATPAKARARTARKR